MSEAQQNTSQGKNNIGGVSAHSNPSMWMDRNVFYNIKAFVHPQDKELTMELVIYMCFLYQAEHTQLLGTQAFQRFTIDEFCAFSKRSKSDTLDKCSDGWTCEKEIIGGKKLVLKSRFDRAMEFLANNEINLRQIYDWKVKSKVSGWSEEEVVMVEMKSPTLIENYYMEVDPSKTKKRTYGVKLNAIIRDSLQNENLAYMYTDLPLLRGKGNYFDLYFQLMAWQNSAANRARNGQKPEYKCQFHRIKELTGVEVTNYSPAKNASREKARINKKLDHLKKTQLNFDYQIIANNTYLFTFKINKPSVLPHEHNLLRLVHNQVVTMIGDYVTDTGMKFKDMSAKQVDEFLDALVSKFSFNQRQKKAYHDVFIDSICSKIETINIDPETIKTKIKDRMSQVLLDARKK